MKKLSRRAVALTPSITIGLILFTVGLTVWLAYRAFEASRSQERQTEHTLREYAAFAAFQLREETRWQIEWKYRAAMHLILRHVITNGPTPSLGAERAAALIRAQGPECRCLGPMAFYFQVALGDSAIETTASDVATPENVRRIRDTVMRHSRAPAPRNPIPPRDAPRLAARVGSPTYIFHQFGDRRYVIAHTVFSDTLGTPVVAYGYVIPAARFVGLGRWEVRSRPLLPAALTGELTVDSILAIRVTDPAGAVIASTTSPVDARYAAVDSLELTPDLLRFEVSIHPAVASRLIIGGLPRSRLPEVLATAFIAVGLLGLLLWQFRRQEELGRLRDDFVSGVSHELRTPLAQIWMLAELLRLGRVPTEEGKERSLRIIDREARRLSLLVNSILDFTQSRRTQLSPVSTDVAVEIGDIIAGFEPLAQADEVQLIPRLEPGLVADVDRGALRQILLNLLDNAVRYGPPRQRVTIATSRAGERWTLEVTDEGPGIPADERERIFDPYYRMQRDAGGAVGGTGIGLAVVRRLVTDHGGEVHVAAAEPTEGNGARFVVTLPIGAAEGSGR